MPDDEVAQPADPDEVLVSLTLTYDEAHDLLSVLHGTLQSLKASDVGHTVWQDVEGLIERLADLLDPLDEAVDAWAEENAEDE